MKHDVLEQTWDAVVIGAGLAGLTAAVILARAGFKVAVLESGAAAGGRAMSSSLAGAAVNLGAHALYEEGAAVLRELGVVPQGASPKLQASFVFGSKPEQFQTAALGGLLLGSRLSWGAKSEFLRFYTSLQRVDTTQLQNVTLDAYFATRFRHVRSRQLAEAFIRVSTYSNAPELLSAGAALDQLKRAAVSYVHGGWQTIVNALAAKAEKAGAVLLTDAAVQQVAGVFPEITVIGKEGWRVRSRYVVSTLAPRRLLAALDGPPAEEYTAKLRTLKPIYAASLDLVMEGLPQPKTTFALGVERPLYFSNHSAAARLSPNPAHAVVHAMTYLPAGQEEHDDASQLERELELMLDRLQPGWRGHVAARRFLPHMRVSNGVAEASEGGLAGRPGVAVTGKPGLYTAGDWVGPEGMLAGASLASARSAAAAIIEHTRFQGLERIGDGAGTRSVISRV